MKAVVDRIIEDMAVVEYRGTCYNIPLVFFPKGIREGSVVRISISYDKSSTEKAEEEISQLMEDVWEK